MYIISEDVYEQIRRSLYLPEMGGILGIDKNKIITEFYFDSTGTNLKYQYIPDVDRLNEVIYEWSLRNVKFIGFVHSHPSNKTELSLVDVKYAKKIKYYCKMNKIVMLLYIPKTDLFFNYII